MMLPSKRRTRLRSLLKVRPSPPNLFILTRFLSMRRRRRSPLFRDLATTTREHTEELTDSTEDLITRCTRDKVSPTKELHQTTEPALGPMSNMTPLTQKNGLIRPVLRLRDTFTLFTKETCKLTHTELTPGMMSSM